MPLNNTHPWYTGEIGRVGTGTHLGAGAIFFGERAWREGKGGRRASQMQVDRYKIGSGEGRGGGGR